MSGAVIYAIYPPSFEQSEAESKNPALGGDIDLDQLGALSTALGMTS